MTMLTNAAAPTVLCCDVCSPSLLDHTQPGMKPHTDHARQVTKKEVSEALFDLIEDWQDNVYKRDYKYSSLQAGNVLPDEAIVKLAHLKLPLTAFAIQAVLANAWPRWDCHGEELTQHLLNSPFASLPSNTGRNSQYARLPDAPLYTQLQSISQSLQYAMQLGYPSDVLSSSTPHIPAPHPVAVSPYVMYPSPPLTQYQPGPSFHSGSFSYQDLVYMANASQKNGYPHSFPPPHSTPLSSSFMPILFHPSHSLPHS
jgi:hypothetical protein